MVSRMKRFAQTVLLRDDPEVIRQYEHYHANPWPEVVAGTCACGIRRVFIYRLGRQLFMFMETDDAFELERDLARYMEHPRAQAWDTLMRGFQEPVADAPSGVTWALLREVYALECSSEGEDRGLA